MPLVGLVDWRCATHLQEAYKQYQDALDYFMMVSYCGGRLFVTDGRR